MSFDIAGAAHDQNQRAKRYARLLAPHPQAPDAYGLLLRNLHLAPHIVESITSHPDHIGLEQPIDWDPKPQSA